MSFVTRGLLAIVMLATCAGFSWARADEPVPPKQEDSAEGDQEPEKKSFWSRFIDPEDGKFDIVAGGKGASGFLPLAVPFNDPAVGVGLVVGLAYFHPSDENTEASGVDLQQGAPTTTFGGGAVSTNGTWAGAVGHYHRWKEGRIRYLGGAAYASANLDFYGIGSGGREEGFSFNVEGGGLVQQAEFQLGQSRFFIGGRYTYLSATTTFDDVLFDDLQGDVDDAALSMLVNYDSRDNVFTPNRGTRASLSVGVSSEKLGGDLGYVRSGLALNRYWEIRNRVNFGVRFEYHTAGAEAPFYSLPFVKLRGIPAFRYLGQHAVTAEIEPRFRINDRWSVLVFTGTGRAGTDLDDLKETDRAYNYGGGFRYLIARKLGLAAGLDVARGPEETVGYIIVGGAW